MRTPETIDKAGTEYWDSLWKQTCRTVPVDPHSRRLSNYVYREFHAYFKSAFASLPTSRMNLVEVGCANSRWLPYFAKEFGFKVAGLDRSETGCKLAREILLRSSIEGDIVCGDLFNPPENMIGRFDVVVSFGVIEHFANAVDCLRAMKLLLHPGGIIITVIPNLIGMMGFIARLLNRRVFNKHVIIDISALTKLHQSAGFHIEDCRYFCNMNFRALSACTVKNHDFSQQSFPKRIIVLLLGRIGFVCHWFEMNMKIPGTKILASYIICRGKLPAE